MNSSTNIRNAWMETLHEYEIDTDLYINTFLNNIFLHEGALSKANKVKWTLEQIEVEDIDEVELLSNFRSNFRRICIKNIEEDPFGTWKFLNKIAESYEFGILSDNSLGTKLMWQELFKEHDLDDLFDFFIVSEEVGKWKPAKEMYEEVYSFSRAKKGELCYFGNSLERDSPSSKFGYQFIHVYGLDNSEPSDTYPHIKQINDEEFNLLGFKP